MMAMQFYDNIKSDVAINYFRGFAVGIYTTNLPDACLHCMKSSNVSIVVVENDMQLQKILQVKDQIPDLKAIIQYSETPTDPSVLTVSLNRYRGNSEYQNQLLLWEHYQNHLLP